MNEDYLVSQNIYKSNSEYTVIYVNKELYEEIFNEKFTDESYKKIKDMFSITLDKNKGEYLLTVGYSDKQEDPLGISLSGNLGSGRAFFYKDIFNIKGEKTSLATSKNTIYSDGNFALPASIKETVVSNIVSKEFSFPSFQTLAVLDKNNSFEFTSEFLGTDNKVKSFTSLVPSALEIRVYKDKEFYRISNAIINKDNFNYEEIKEFSRRIAIIEAEKFIKRFLHGSWSVGNISTHANMIDFDTSCYVIGRNPTFSNTNKYKASYFGYEILGNKNIVKILCENNNINYEDMDKYIDRVYQEYLKIGFVNLIGLDYEKHYKKYKSDIDSLFNKFINMSREFVPNYYDLSVYRENTDNTFVYDFSKFFQRYLILKEDKPNDKLLGISLLINKTLKVEYEDDSFAKEKAEEYFKDLIVDYSDSSALIHSIEFISEYDNLFNKIDKKELESIKFKQFINNANKEYIYSNENLFDQLTHQYIDNQVDRTIIDKIINYIIKVNTRDNENKILLNLEVYEDYLTYMVIENRQYYYVIVPFNDYVRFAKLFSNEEEYMFHFEEDVFVSDKIKYDDLSIMFDLKDYIKVNGKTDNKNMLLRY